LPAFPFDFNGCRITAHKALLDARFGDKKVLTSDLWTYVELWLRRNSTKDTLFYWEQSQQFAIASKSVSIEAAPLLIYYSFLNGVKALLSHRKIVCGPHHGVSGESTSRKATIAGEHIKINNGGVAPALSKLLADHRNAYTLKDILYNLPFIHRAYILTYRSSLELFVRLENQYMVIKKGSSEAWFVLWPSKKGFSEEYIIKYLPAEIERDRGLEGELIVRFRKRFKWEEEPSKLKDNLERLSFYNTKCRHNLHYISGIPSSWYLKLRPNAHSVIDRSDIILMFLAMHRLSELSRYDPFRLHSLLGTNQNWLVSEFVRSSPYQFLDEIAALITGQDLAPPYVTHGR
jgi:hypothetical protein